MENLNLYNHKASVAFNNYLQGNSTLEELIQQLRSIENQLKQNDPQGSLWFKFSGDDTLATSISELEKDLSNNNREFTMERMSESIILKNELFIYYS